MVKLVKTTRKATPHFFLFGSCYISKPLKPLTLSFFTLLVKKIQKSKDLVPREIFPFWGRTALTPKRYTPKRYTPKRKNDFGVQLSYPEPFRGTNPHTPSLFGVQLSFGLQRGLSLYVRPSKGVYPVPLRGVSFRGTRYGGSLLRVPDNALTPKNLSPYPEKTLLEGILPLSRKTFTLYPEKSFLPLWGSLSSIPRKLSALYP